MATIAVRVAPRSGRTAVEIGPDGIIVRVRSAAEGGKATEEARRALAEAAGVPSSAVTLRSGSRSRTKIFDVQGRDADQLDRRLRGA